MATIAINAIYLFIGLTAINFTDYLVKYWGFIVHNAIHSNRIIHIISINSYLVHSMVGVWLAVLLVVGVGYIVNSYIDDIRRLKAKINNMLFYI